MIVFKNYFKMVKKFVPTIIIYMVIFTFFAIVSTTSNTSTIYTNIKPKIAVINNDNSLITDTFISYIEENAKIVEIENSEEALKDALFYRKVDYIILIPKGFGGLLLDRQTPKMETRKVPDSYNAVYSEMLFNRFLNVVDTYAKVGMNEEKISNIILDTLKETVSVTMLSNNYQELEKVQYFYNFTNYTILATSILIIGMLINIFNKDIIKKRNIISKTSYKSLNFQLFLGNACISAITWLSYVVISICLYSDVMLSKIGTLFIINSLILCFVALGFGFLIGNLVKNAEAQNGIVNVIALGSSFICGAFVPQQYLGDFVLTIAKAFPSYWYIKNNLEITLLSNVNYDTLKPILMNSLVMLLFGIALFLITNIITKLQVRGKIGY